MRSSRKPSLTNRLTLEAPKRIADGGGGHVIEWEEVGTLWAEIQPTGARERVSGLVASARVTHRISVRAAPVGNPRRPTAEQRFRQGTRIFAIRGVAEMDPRGAHLTCWAEEGPFA